MKTKLQKIRLGMNPDEFISVGKYWLWMTVFSACLFASCGETNHPQQEPAMTNPKAQALPVKLEKSGIHEDIPEERIHLDPQDYEEIQESEINDSDLEPFGDDGTPSEEFEEIREAEPEDESREVRSMPAINKDAPEAQTEIALRKTRDSMDPDAQRPSPVTSPPSSPKDSESSDAEAKWEAQFQVTGDSDAFEPDSPDDFASDSTTDFGSDTSNGLE
jgi:hypothetical protein